MTLLQSSDRRGVDVAGTCNIGLGFALANRAKRTALDARSPIGAPHTVALASKGL